MQTAATDIILPRDSDAPLHSGSVLRWILFFISPYKKIVWSFVAYRFIRFSYFASLPAIIGFIIDAVSEGRFAADPWLYAGGLGLYFTFFALMQITNLIFCIEVNAWEKLQRGMTLFSLRHLTRLPLDWHEAQGSGGKLQRVMTARKALDSLGMMMRWTFIPVASSLIGVVISMIALDAPWFYIPLYFLFFVSYFITSWYFGRPVEKLYDKFNKKFEKLLSGVYEFVSSIRTVKAFALDRHILERGYALEMEGQQAIQRVIWQIFFRWTIMNAVGVFWILTFVAIGLTGTLQGWLSVGTFTATFFLALSVLSGLEQIAIITEEMYKDINGMRRLIDTLRTPIPPLDIEPLQPLRADWQTIRFDDLTFVYSDKEAQGVHGVSFDVRRGEKIAFVGASGAGKSTLAKLLMKQMLPQGGDIRIDDTALRHIRADEWLSQIGFVPQDVELFNLSIRDNILIDREDTDEVFYKMVLEQAALSDFITSLPDGDRTIIGERGIKLSGGQRQRLGIARALIRNTPIMVFDEATSSLDSLSEQQIQEAIDVSFAGRTVFLIAHRLSTVRHVDKILVLDHGRIIEQGSFDELTSRPNGTFARLWSLQS